MKTNKNKSLFCIVLLCIFAAKLIYHHIENCKTYLIKLLWRLVAFLCDDWINFAKGAVFSQNKLRENSVFVTYFRIEKSCNIPKNKNQSINRATCETSRPGLQHNPMLCNGHPCRGGYSYESVLL